MEEELIDREKEMDSYYRQQALSMAIELGKGNGVPAESIVKSAKVFYEFLKNNS